MHTSRTLLPLPLPLLPFLPLSLLISLLLHGSLAAAEPVPATNQVSYQLPTEGPLPRTYRVTLAAAPAERPDWIVSNFVSGAVRTVTPENGGRFTETWDARDDNFMPLPPGEYVIRAIVMPAEKWEMTGEYHTLIPRYRFAAGDSWSPAPDQDRRFPWVFGHVFGNPTDIDIALNRRAGLWAHYIENAWSPFLWDVSKPTGFDQVLQTWSSAGRAGGPAIATDGERLYASCENGGFPYLFTPEPTGFNTTQNGYGFPCRRTPQLAQSVAAWKSPDSDRRVVYATQAPDPHGPDSFLLVLDGNDGSEIARINSPEPLAVVLPRRERPDALFVLHKSQGAEDPTHHTVSRLPLTDGLPTGELERVFTVPLEIPDPADLQVDSRGRFYVSSPGRHQVFQLDAQGSVLRVLGQEGGIKPGRVDPRAMIAPTRLACWTDEAGRDWVLAVESRGPGRVAEWGADTGERGRTWYLAQPAQAGYTIDPQRPEHLYSVSIYHHLLCRWVVDYQTGAWELESTWPLPLAGGMNPRVIRHPDHPGQVYFAFGGGFQSGWVFAVYRLDEATQTLTPSAGIIADPALPEQERIRRGHFWHDANGDGRVSADEHTDRAMLPTINWWGDQFADDLSMMVLTPDVSLWRLRPDGFDAHQNPIYRGENWVRVLNDPTPSAKAAGTAGPLDGGNELSIHYGTHWYDVVEDGSGGYFIADSFGRNNPGGMDTAGNYFAQVKLTRYTPDAQGNPVLRYRVGRKAHRLMQPGEMYAAHMMAGPTHGLVGIFDSNGLYHVYTENGMFVDTLLWDAFRGGVREGGMYSHSGESWFGEHHGDPHSGRVYLRVGRAQYTVYEVEGWEPGVVRPLAVEPERLRLTARHFTPGDPHALLLRGGTDRPLGLIRAATSGEPAMDGSMAGWAAAEPISFGLDDQRRVEARLLFRPGTLYVRWHVRLPTELNPLDLGDPSRLFTHERGGDFVSLYLQGDPDARLSGEGQESGRPGDVRFIFGLTGWAGERVPVCLGMYPYYDGPDARPAEYRSPIRSVSLAHVALLEDVRMGHRMDEDGRGFTLTAAIPVSRLPGVTKLAAGVQTTGNLAATFGGVANVWWANTGKLTVTNTTDEPSEAQLYPGAWTPLRFAW